VRRFSLKRRGRPATEGEKRTNRKRAGAGKKKKALPSEGRQRSVSVKGEAGKRKKKGEKELFLRRDIQRHRARGGRYRESGGMRKGNLRKNSMQTSQRFISRKGGSLDIGVEGGGGSEKQKKNGKGINRPNVQVQCRGVWEGAAVLVRPSVGKDEGVKEDLSLIN